MRYIGKLYDLNDSVTCRRVFVFIRGVYIVIGFNEFSKIGTT